MLKKEGFLSLYPETALSAMSNFVCVIHVARSLRIRTIYYNTNVLKISQSFETRLSDQPI
jgi:hypothetical protein